MIIDQPRDTRAPRLTLDCKGGKRGKGISFKERHRKNDAAMVPDVGFTKQLKALDPELEVMWDWIGERWAIWCFPKAEQKEPYHVMTVQTKGRSYQELGQQVLLRLTEIESERYEAGKVLAYLEEHNRQVQRRKAKEFSEKIRAITNETYNFARGVLQVQVPRSTAISGVLK